MLAVGVPLSCSVYDESLLVQKPEASTPLYCGEAPHAVVPSVPSSIGFKSSGDVHVVAVEETVDLGDGDTGSTAYNSIGFDLDDECTIDSNRQTPSSCKLPTEATGVLDGPGAVDNAAGSFIQHIHDTFLDFYSSSALQKTLLRSGTGSNLIVRVTGWNGESDDDKVDVELFQAAPFNAFAPNSDTTPQWINGDDVWPVASEPVPSDAGEAGQARQPLAEDTAAYVRTSFVVAKLPFVEFRLALAFKAGNVLFGVKLWGAQLLCHLQSTAAGWTTDKCTLAGKWLANDMVHELARLPDPSRSTPDSATPCGIVDGVPQCPLCAVGGSSSGVGGSAGLDGSTSSGGSAAGEASASTGSGEAYVDFKSAICSQIDSLSGSSGTDSSQTCDALSFGMSWTGQPAVLGNAFQVAPLANPCPYPYYDPANDCCDNVNPGPFRGICGFDGGAGTGDSGGSGATDGGNDASSTDSSAG